MVVHDWSKLNRMWDSGRVTQDQLIGQLIRWGWQMYESELETQQEIVFLRQEVEALSIEVLALTQQLEQGNKWAISCEEAKSQDTCVL